MKPFNPITKAWDKVKEQAQDLKQRVLAARAGGPVPIAGSGTTELETHLEIDLPETVWTEDLPVIYAVGDIHGRCDLLERMLKAIREDCEIAPEAGPKPQVVFLGDYIDRGFQSRKVIQTLINLKDQSVFDPIYLRGNHEDVFQTFLKNPAVGPQWSSFGGRETLISYGITPPLSANAENDWLRAQADLRNSIPESHVKFLADLQNFHQIGPFGFVHAGVRSGVPFEAQKNEDRLWIRGEFLNAQEREDLFIVHGHTPVDEPYADHRRINVDTGAYYSGRLTAVKIEAKNAVFLTL